MSKTNYPGIDYSAGQAVNRNPDTGFRYGVIPSNDVSPDAMEDVYSNGRNLDFESAVDQFKDSIAQCENETELAALLKASFYSRCNPNLWAQAILTELSDNNLVLQSMDANQAIWNEVEQTFCDQYEGTGDCTRYSYESDGYKLQVAGDGEIFVIASPFFTYAQLCSPCAPGACYLKSPLEGPSEANKCYCLGADWFDSDSPCPYPIYSVATGEQI